VNRLVALLRGINVGRAKRISMADLKALIERLGYSDVRTLLNSGNVVFGAPAKLRDRAASRIEAAMTKELGVSARVTVLTAAELALIVAANPLAEAVTDPSRMLVTVLTDPRERSRLEPLTAKRWAPDALVLGDRVAYCWCPAGVLESPLAVTVARAIGDGGTTRNWTTLTKLHAIASSP
jgi:uncharacterized protein (DUF1697 family)